MDFKTSIRFFVITPYLSERSALIKITKIA